MRREVEHCGGRITVSPFDIYFDCPDYARRIKILVLLGWNDIEDLFDRGVRMDEPACA